MAIANDTKKVRVILAVRPRMKHESLKDQLEESDRIDVVAVTRTPFELLQIAELGQAEAVIVENSEKKPMPGVLTHLFAEFPQMTAITIDQNSNRCVVYQQKIVERRLAISSLRDLLSELQNADQDYWSPG